ncbi:hypothetical protein Taro_002169 [Colocasia esculenta]|uniref:Uncharacterized protein n=1 Tax=Colocasia esculenta TaxID=4460 RepID=A0A843TGI3_COLES|nr:hypothetical protein [Colocasia esculenta]
MDATNGAFEHTLVRMLTAVLRCDDVVEPCSPAPELSRATSSTTVAVGRISLPDERATTFALGAMRRGFLLEAFPQTALNAAARAKGVDQGQSEWAPRRWCVVVGEGVVLRPGARSPGLPDAKGGEVSWPEIFEPFHIKPARISVSPFLRVSIFDMVRGARSGASSGRGLCGRVLLEASNSGSSSVPPSGEFRPPQPRGPVAGPSSVSPTVAAAIGVASVSPPLAAGSGQSTHSPDTVVGSVSKDDVSLQEGGGSFYESTLREVWINGDKIEPAQASQFITRTMQSHFPGPIHRFNDFPMEVQELLYQMFMSNHRFTRRSDEARSRLVWTMTTRSNFKHLLYNARKNVEKVSQSADPTLWRERAPSWMRRDYWEHYKKKKTYNFA